MVHWDHRASGVSQDPRGQQEQREQLVFEVPPGHQGHQDRRDQQARLDFKVPPAQVESLGLLVRPVSREQWATQFSAIVHHKTSVFLLHRLTCSECRVANQLLQFINLGIDCPSFSHRKRWRKHPKQLFFRLLVCHLIE